VEEALKELIKFYSQHGAIIREIRSDQGGEYGGSNETFSHHGEGGTLRDSNSLDFYFKRVCNQHNIKHVLMPAYRPELHGIAERWNKTVMQMANSMLFASRLSHIL
jgi:transposase InsO family protein